MMISTMMVRMMMMGMMTLMMMRMMTVVHYATMVFQDYRCYRRSIHPVHATHSSIIVRGLHFSRLPLLSHRQHRLLHEVRRER
jgi:hypothetical protein